MAESIPNWVVGLIVGLASIGIAAVGLLVSKLKDTEVRGREAGSILQKIDSLDRKVDGLISAQSSQISSCQTHRERVAIVEQSAKSAHHRLDALESALRGRQNGDLS